MATWGVALSPGKVAPFVPPPEGGRLHLSQAVLVPPREKEGKNEGSFHCLVFYRARGEKGEKEEGAGGSSPELALAALRCGSSASSSSPSCDNVPLDLIFDEYTEFRLEVRGGGANLGDAAKDVQVHLTGYHLPDFGGEEEGGGCGRDRDGCEEEEEELSDEEDLALARLADGSKGALYDSESEDGMISDEDDDSEEEDEDDDDSESESVSGSESESYSDDDESESDLSDSDSDSDEEEEDRATVPSSVVIEELDGDENKKETAEADKKEKAGGEEDAGGSSESDDDDSSDDSSDDEELSSSDEEEEGSGDDEPDDEPVAAAPAWGGGEGKGKDDGGNAKRKASDENAGDDDANKKRKPAASVAPTTPPAAAAAEVKQQQAEKQQQAQKQQKQQQQAEKQQQAQKQQKQQQQQKEQQQAQKLKERQQLAQKLKEQEAAASASERVRRFDNGFVIETLASSKSATAPMAKAGKRVKVRYVGKLAKTGKVFDQTKGAATFSFRLGVGEVIKGWDRGVENMRVGDKRRLTIPPQMGYGASGVRGAIPGNATLVFDVELVGVQ